MLNLNRKKKKKEKKYLLLKYSNSSDMTTQFIVGLLRTLVMFFISPYCCLLFLFCYCCIIYPKGSYFWGLQTDSLLLWQFLFHWQQHLPSGEQLWTVSGEISINLRELVVILQFNKRCFNALIEDLSPQEGLCPNTGHSVRPQLTPQTLTFPEITPSWQGQKNTVLASVCTYTEAKRVRDYLCKVTLCSRGPC